MKRLVCTSAILILAFLNTFAQTPGGVSGANLKLWLRADKDITLRKADSINSWKNQVAGAGLTEMTQSDSTMQPLLLPAALNFNPTVSFNGGNQFLLSNTLKGSDLLSAQNNSAFFVISQKSGVVNSMFEKSGSGSQRFGMEAKDGKMRFDFPNGGAGQVVTNAPIVGNGFFQLGFISKNRGNTPATDTLKSTLYVSGKKDTEKLITAILGTTTFNTAEANMKYSLGKHHHWGVNSECEVAEVLIYNTNLSDADREKVESYLAMKYALKLEHNLLNSSGEVVYDISSNNNNMLTIGRNDGGAFLQKQSRDADNNSFLYLGLLQNTNGENAGTFSSDKSFIAAGHNGLNADFVTTEIPANVNKRIAREWKLKNTNTTESFNIGVRLSPAAISEISNVGKLNLLVDDDGDFANATVVKSGQMNGFSISVSGDIVYLSGISNDIIPKNTTKYITIGEDNTDATVMPPVANFTFSIQGKETIFTDASLNNPDSWTWNFGDGSASQDQSPSHSYTEDGSYNACLKVANSAGNDSICKTVLIATTSNAPLANFTFNVKAKDVMFTDASLNNPETWSWNFGDGGTSQDQNPAHTYAEDGLYDVCLTVTNTSGSDSTCKAVQIGATGIAGIVDDSQITIYPNPVADNLYISGDLSEKVYDLSVFNTLGVKLYQAEVINGSLPSCQNCDNKTTNFSLPIADLTNGIYILYLKGMKTFSSREFMVAR